LLYFGGDFILGSAACGDGVMAPNILAGAWVYWSAVTTAAGAKTLSSSSTGLRGVEEWDFGYATLTLALPSFRLLLFPVPDLCFLPTPCFRGMVAEVFTRNKCNLRWHKKCGFCIPFWGRSAYTIALQVGPNTFYNACRMYWAIYISIHD
jgi:hypothetical protein